MSQWSSHHKLTLWQDLPLDAIKQLAKKSVKISRADVYLKPCLVQVAHAAVKDRDCDYYANKFNQISKRRSKKSAIIAIVRRILIAIYHMIKTDELFNPSDLADIETSQKKRIEYIKNNSKNAYNQLMRTELSEKQILTIFPTKSTDSLLIE